jgi:hypothetical protein
MNEQRMNGEEKEKGKGNAWHCLVRREEENYTPPSQGSSFTISPWDWIR